MPDVAPRDVVPKRRGRPRDEAAKQRILEAARALLREHGVTGITMEGVAQRAGVGKPTVYRWFGDRHALAMAALMEGVPSPAASEPARSALGALKKQLRAIAERFGAPDGRLVASMIAAADAGSELSRAFRNHFVLARREEGRALLLEAIAEGELRRAIDVEVALDLLYGPLFFRLLLGHGPLDAAFTDAVLAHALRGLRRASKSP